MHDPVHDQARRRLTETFTEFLNAHRDYKRGAIDRPHYLWARAAFENAEAELARIEGFYTRFRK